MVAFGVTAAGFEAAPLLTGFTGTGAFTGAGFTLFMVEEGVFFAGADSMKVSRDPFFLGSIGGSTTDFEPGTDSDLI